MILLIYTVGAILNLGYCLRAYEVFNQVDLKDVLATAFIVLILTLLWFLIWPILLGDYLGCVDNDADDDYAL